VEFTFTGVDHADATDLEFLSLAARRGISFAVVGPSTFRPEAGSASYHDSQAALLDNEFSLRLGELLYHRRRGSSPAAAVAAYKAAIDHCMSEAFYDAGLALVEELAEFADPAGRGWAQSRRADLLFVLGRPAEADPIYTDPADVASRIELIDARLPPNGMARIGARCGTNAAGCCPPRPVRRGEGRLRPHHRTRSF
jgi:hypothetical protein